MLDPIIADFRENLDTVNALADASAGSVWRLQDDSGNASTPPPSRFPAATATPARCEVHGRTRPSLGSALSGTGAR
jgi:hypothetical protein